MAKSNELHFSELRQTCDPKLFDFKNTSEIKPLEGVIGQKRAVQAIDFGLNMQSPGYNIFVTGVEGTGKSTIAGQLVRDHARSMEIPSDWCMVNDFKDDYRPRAIAIPPGKAVKFSREMNKAIEDLKRDLPRAISHEGFQARKSSVQKKYADRQRRVFRKIEKMAQERSLNVSQTDAGLQTFAVVDGQPLTEDQFEALSRKARQELEENIRFLDNEIEVASREINRLSQGLKVEIEKLLDRETLAVVKTRFETIRKDYSKVNDILEFLDRAQEDIIENVQNFFPVDPDKLSPFPSQPGETPLTRYRVNVLVDRSGTRGAPVIFESNPTYSNLFGKIEKRAYMGAVTTDFTMIQAGSLLKANGGFLIMEVESALSEAYSWESLKRALQTKSLQIEDVAAEMGFVTASLRPEPIPLEVKVILLGRYYPFRLLQDYDSKFNKIFKVRADFDYEVKRNEDTVHQYARFIARVCEEERLLPFTAGAVAAIVEYGEKRVADQNKLSLRFGPIQGTLKEADYWARKRGGRVVTEKDAVQAFKEYRFRYNLYEEKIHESYVDKTILIDVSGSVVGQVNALAVYQIGDYSFGRPARITAETYMGRRGVINIEREAKLSGKTHDKGVLILSGYLGRMFAQSYPLSLSISVTFEQSYGGIDGDSASSTELYAILSSLADVPIRQGIAVTGSVNQKGKVQAIGGVNHKIEGFFEVCMARGLTGDQGVLIPRSNLKNLMLRKEIVDAVKEDKFHIYAVSTVEEGIEILTGMPAGEADSDGVYPPETVYRRAQKKLRHYLERTVRYRKELAGEDDSDIDGLDEGNEMKGK